MATEGACLRCLSALLGVLRRGHIEETPTKNAAGKSYSVTGIIEQVRVIIPPNPPAPGTHARSSSHPGEPSYLPLPSPTYTDED